MDAPRPTGLVLQGRTDNLLGVRSDIARNLVEELGTKVAQVLEVAPVVAVAAVAIVAAVARHGVGGSVGAEGGVLAPWDEDNAPTLIEQLHNTIRLQPPEVVR